ncbi:MAG: HEAT repeat domain-containing protein [Kofleriaceae bacterium]
MRSSAGTVRVVVARVIALVLLVATAPAFADNLDTLIDQLTDSSDRVRTSAVLALTNQENPRAIEPLVKTLLSKSEKKNIRGLAANAIGRIVQNGKPGAAQKKAAVDALGIAKSDPEPFVSAKAEAALDMLGAAAPATPTKVSSTGGIYVNIGPMSSKTSTADDAKYRTLMQKVATTTMGRVAAAMKTTWPNGAPTRQALDRAGVAGFYVDGTLNEVKVEKTGNATKVSCKVNMLLASFPEKAVFGFLNGGAQVQASSSGSDVALAQQDCVQAVVEDLIAKKIVPTIKSKAGP